MTRRPSALLGTALTLALTLSGCGGDDGETLTQMPVAAPTTEAAAPAAEPCRSAPPTAPAPASATQDLKTKPVLGKGEGPPPCGLVVSDIVVGTGAEATAGKTVSVQYVGVDHATGEQFDASWDRGGEPFTFPLGGGRVIPGWDQGVAGMKVGGRRMLVIPPQLAYGEQGTGPIGPNATLVFVVDLLKVA